MLENENIRERKVTGRMKRKSGRVGGRKGEACRKKPSVKLR